MRIGPAEPCLRETVIECQRAFLSSDRGVASLQLLQAVSTRGDGFDEVGIECKRTIKVSKRRLVFPERAEHKAADEPGFSEIGLQRDGSIVSSERITILLQLRKDVTTAE